MVKMKKVLSVVLAGALFAAVVSLSSAASAPKTVTPGTLTIGVDTTYPPMEFVKTTGSGYQGFDIDMANAIGKKLGMKVQITSIVWSGIFNALNSKRFDCIISSVSVTPTREKTLLFTKPYLKNAQVIITRKGDNRIKKLTDLKGANIGCQTGTTASDSLDTLKNVHKYKFNETTYDAMTDCLLALKTKRVDVVVCDEVVGDYFVKDQPSVYQKVGPTLTNEPIGVCFRKDSAALRDKVQAGINAIIKDGTMKKISVKWFGKDLTSNIDTKYKELK
jgi:ABC-type amino acid transport/signal transduction systems, periplasmic component/domain